MVGMIKPVRIAVYAKAAPHDKASYNYEVIAINVAAIKRIENYSHHGWCKIYFIDWQPSHSSAPTIVTMPMRELLTHLNGKEVYYPLCEKCEADVWEVAK